MITFCAFLPTHSKCEHLPFVVLGDFLEVGFFFEEEEEEEEDDEEDEEEEDDDDTAVEEGESAGRS